MSIPKRILRAKRWPRVLVGLTTVLGTLSACAKLVGIEDTTVTRADGSAGAAGSSAGAAQAGTSNAGQSNGGSPPGGAGATAGSQAGGAGGATAGGGGALNQAGNGGGAGVSECPCSAPNPTCENGKCVVRGPTMAKATSYYIDSTEVSKAEYDVFLKAKGQDTSGQIAECAWNKSYAPDGAVVDDQRPIVNVDWCDAAAYCTWADKRLCGAIGGGAVAAADLNSPTRSQWYLACAGADNERYPYGGFVLKPDYCNEYFSGSMADVGKFEQCEGHYAGIFDLVGNAAEWIDSCDTADGTDRALDACQLSGGSYINDMYTCQTYFSSPRNDVADVFGFRCCSK
jgi:sulfatase modifying factor 1